MVHMIMGGLGVIMGFFGLLANLYILLILVLHKKTRSSSEWILLHLSSCGIGASLCNIFFSGPSILWENWLTSKYPYCDFVGAFVLIIQFLTVWSICALSADRCAAIASPLRYTQVVTQQRVGIYFLTVWMLSLMTVTMAFFLSSFHDAGMMGSDSVANAQSHVIHSHFQNGESQDSSYEHENEGHQTLFQFSNFSEDPLTLQTSSPLFEVMDLTFHVEGRDGTRDNRERRLMPWDDSVSDESQSVIISPAIEKNHYDGVLSGRNVVETLVFEFRPIAGLCLPKVTGFSWWNLAWTSEWVLFILIIPMIILLTCDLTVLSIARRQRHRIVMALYQITLSVQATVTRTKGTVPSSLWMNQTVPAKSRACRAVWEDLGSLFILNSPMILITIAEGLSQEFLSPELITFVGTIALFLVPIYNALLYGVRARPIRATVRSYLRKRMTNSTLQQEIQQRLSPVDCSPRPSSRAKSFRSSTPSPNSSFSETPTRRRLSSNDLRPPPPTSHYLTSSPSHGQLGRRRHNQSNISMKARKVRSYLHIPTHCDAQEFWSGLRKPQRSPTIVITHEIRLKDSVNSLVSSSPSPITNNAEHAL